MNAIPTILWLEDPNVFAVNRLPAHSDHRYYETKEEAKNKNEMRWRYSLNGNWKFCYSNNPTSRPERFYEAEFSCNGWGDILVPGHIQMQGYGKPQYVNTMYPWDGIEHLRPPEISKENNPVGSYVKYFFLPENMKNKQVYISFQGVETAFYVWLNGEFIGYSEDSFTPAEFDLSPYIKAGENKLAVEVYQRSTGSWLEDQDFWRVSGIFRDVYLYTFPEIHAYDVKINASLEENYTKGNISVDLKLNSNNGTGKLILEDRNGFVIASTSFQLDEISKCQIDTPFLWSAENPYLYNLYIELYNKKGNLVEVVPTKIGFRKFEMINTLMCINGKRIIFKGVNRHEFHHRKGRAIGEEEMLWDIQTLKRHNINAVRTSHYPNQTLWYELCDEYGIYVIDEMNLETHGSWQKMGAVEPSWNIPGNKKEWLPIVMDRAISMYERDKNHPSILIWSCGNESYAGEVILEVSNYFRKEDPTRLVHYEGVFHNREYNDTSDIESRMYAKPVDIEKYLKEAPEKPYISCEYMHAMGNSLGGMHKYIELEQKYEMYQGGFIWDYIDQSIVKKDRYGNEYFAYGGDFEDRPTDYGFCTNGIVYADRSLSPKMQEVKFLYQDYKLITNKKGVTVKNESLFSDIKDYFLQYALYFEGKETYRKTVELSIEPNKEKYVEFNLPDSILSEFGEYSIITSLHLKEDKLWAKKGYEIAFGQTIFRVGEKQINRTITGNPLKIVEGDVNIGIHGKDFTVLFSKQMGSLVSLQYEGREMIASPPQPSFWRATTDNDRGFSQEYTSGLWFAASLGRKCIEVDFEQHEDSAKVSFTYQFSISQTLRVRIEYLVHKNGSLTVKSIYSGAEGLPQLPIFALVFKVPAAYEYLKWYANGPQENYSDRSMGAKLGLFSNRVTDNLSNYLVPQESGNRTGVRKLCVTNSNGKGIEIESTILPLECNVSPYTAFELENAKHHFELPNIHYSVITIAGKQMGVGGDDSWGAPVHQEFLIDSSKEVIFEFTLSKC